MIYLQLFLSYLKIGFFGFGGGYAMLSLIQNEMVTRHGWMTATELADIVAVSQMTPGPIGINAATYIGYDVLFQATGSHLLGVAGSGAATLALMLPSFLIMLAIVKFYTKFRSSSLFEGTMGWLRPCVAGLIGAAAVILIVKTTWAGWTPSFALVEENFPDWKSWLLLGGAFAASFWGKVNPILLIILGAILGIVLY